MLTGADTILGGHLIMDLVKRFFKFVVPSIVSMWIFSL